MKSPFPGMDPYLEAPVRWLGIHNQFLADARRAIKRTLPPGYVTELEERLVIDEGGSYRADVSVKKWDGASGGTATASLLEAPVVRELPSPVSEWLIEVRTASGDLVTTIELLSWSNKRPGRDRDQFLARREELLAGDTNYVEVDLLRGGRTMPGCEVGDAAYRAFVSEASQRPRYGLWPIALRDRLPDLPIPLLPRDRPAELPLQSVLEDVLDVGDYVPRLYAEKLIPPLSVDDAEWATGLVSSVTQ